MMEDHLSLPLQLAYKAHQNFSSHIQANSHIKQVESSDHWVKGKEKLPQLPLRSIQRRTKKRLLSRIFESTVHYNTISWPTMCLFTSWSLLRVTTVGQFSVNKWWNWTNS